MNRKLAGILVVVVLVLVAIVALGLHLLTPPHRPGNGNGSGESTSYLTLSGEERPATWARKLSRPGLHNLHKVSDDLYRGAQPTAEGMKELKKMGIKTLVNLQSFHSDRDEMKAAGVEFNYQHIWMKAWHAEDKEIVRFLKIFNDKQNLPVFVHCRHGADRTGTMCAIYRVAVQGWTKEEALKEMTQGGMGFHRIWQNLLRYVNKLDIAEMKKRAGMK